MSENAFENYQNKINNLGDQKAMIDREQDDYTLRKAKYFLFFDDDTAVEFLASERFPNDPYAANRYENINGELYYRDDDNQLRKEFPDNQAVGFFGDSVVPNLVPAANFGADVYSGIKGMELGMKAGVRLVANPALPFTKNPYAAGAVILGSTMAGGFGLNYAVGGGARLTREALINQFYNAPPDELAAAFRDLNISAAFSAIPLGTGPARGVISKFSGNDKQLQYLVNLRASADETIKEAKRLGFDLTPAEAAEIGNKGVAIQHFLSRQPEIRGINDFYANRASQIRETVESFAEQIGSGKATGDINKRLADAGERAIEQLANKRRTRAGKLYDYIKTSPEPIIVNNVDEIIKKIDSKIAGEILDEGGKVIRTVEPDPNTVKNLEKFRKLFFDQDGQLINDLSALDARRTSSMQDIINDVSGTGDFGIITNLRKDLTALMDEAEPIYAQARRIYDPTKPSLQIIERSSIGKLSKLMTDKQSATALKNVFDPSVSPQSLRNSRRVLQAIDADLFQDVKKEFILQQLDKVTKETLDQGIPRFQQYFGQKNTQAMMKEMLSPEEFDNFYRMNELIGKAFSVPRGGSPTQPFGALQEQLTQESTGLGAKAVNTLLAITRLPARIFTPAGTDALTEGISLKQREAYYQKLADILIDPDATKTVDEIYNYVEVVEPAIYQSILRGGAELVEDVREPSRKTYQTEPQPGAFESLQQQIENFDTTSIDTKVDEPLSPVERISPTIIPDEKDREIAMRQAGGIGSLV